MQKHILLLRLLGVLAIVGVNVAAVMLGDKVPAIEVAATAVCWYIGKLLGVPLDAVVKQALASDPDKAVDIAAEAIRSMPPVAAEVATRALLASIPPDAQQRVVVLLNTTTPPPSLPVQPPSGVVPK